MNLGADYQLVKSIFEASSNFNNKKPRVKRAKEKSMNKHDSFFSYIKQAHPTIFSKVPIFALMCFFTEKVAKWKVVTLHNTPPISSYILGGPQNFAKSPPIL